MKSIWICLFAFGTLTANSAHANSENSLTLYAYPSPGINWKTPGSLTRSILFNEIRPGTKLWHKIGHASVELNCEESGGNSWHEHFGMTSENNSDERDLILKKGTGLGVLFYNFNGRIQRTRELESDIEPRTHTGKIAFIKFQIGHDTCQRLRSYVEEYLEKGYDQHYGLPLRPRMREGGGCTAFATSFLENAGLLNAEMDALWQRELAVPKKWIGGPGTNKKVSIWSLFFNLGAHWANPLTDPATSYVSIKFWDPDLIFNWIQEQYQNPSMGFGSARMDQALGIVTDARSVPTPSEPVFIRPE